MKEALLKHIKTVFEAIKLENITLKIYDSDDFPSELDFVNVTNEFIVVAYCSDYIDIEQIRHKIENFLGKNICSDIASKIIYWNDGESLIDNDSLMDYGFDIFSEQPFLKLNTNVSLPAWLDRFIFNDLDAVYSPDFNKFEHNLELNDDDSRVYLGTYFPRSYAESFCILDNIFQHNKYSDYIKSATLRILDIGSGSGGELIGLLTIIEKYCHETTTIEIYTFDGNKNALNILEKVVDKFRTRTNKTILLKTHQYIFDNLVDFDLFNFDIHKHRFDFILSFKFICELINKKVDPVYNAYFEITKLCLPLLNDFGLFLLLDVTTKSADNEYLPVLMNFQVNRAIQQNSDFNTLIPISCNKYGVICNRSCFIQKSFQVTHSKKNNDKSKVAYRVVTNKLVADIFSVSLDAKYIVKWNDKNDNDCCHYSMANNNIHDSFNLI